MDQRPEVIPGAQRANDTVSIVVACRNEAKFIDSFLSALLRQDFEGLDWEVLIADGMSDDGTREKLRRLCEGNPRIRLIDNPSRIVSTGLNAAIRAARCDAIVRMDVHTEYRVDYVSQSVRCLRRTSAANVGGACIAVGTGYVGRAIASAFHSGFAIGGASWHRPTHQGSADTVHLGCWRREVLQQVGLFDETLVRNQDDELNLRLRRAGGVIWQSPEIVSWYHPRSSLTALFRQYFQFGFWRVAVIRKHRLPGAWRQIAPAAFIVANLVFLAAAILQKIGGQGWLSWFTAFGVAMDAIYLISSLAAAFVAAKRESWALFPLLPIVFATYHISYGSGFLFGIFYFFFAKASALIQVRRERFFSQLSR